MHKKNNLEDRLIKCAPVLTESDLKNKNMLTAASEKDYLDTESIFKNGNPVHLEIGCGKGKFVCDMARKFPGINFVACEKISNVLIDACERAMQENIKNVHFLNCAAEVLQKYFPPKSVEKIYLNFSNPLPREGYKKQRLTHPRFLKIYRDILIDGGEIIQKTDDKAFYEFSLESYKAENFRIISTDENYQVSDSDAETEHEKLFKSMGRSIFRIAVKI